MLSCPPCTENSFLLAILSLAVLNILERYATALQRQTSTNDNDDDGSSSSSAAKRNCVDPDTVSKLAHSIISSGRVPSRVIVSELCRLQSLVNHLAPKIVHTSEALDSMEAGIRGALAVLAGEIMDRLKQY
ncbi:hypothetical protein BJY01DRAFT_217911 [Aspergillus pseudoustus]|uniref:Aflatoxin regulatory protein domain-containing protein n=1 Tax=Aspergillus pseudoustus TaxID=1810923 RepID=A0ABR4JMD1_9EURO